MPPNSTPLKGIKRRNADQAQRSPKSPERLARTSSTSDAPGIRGTDQPSQATGDEEQVAESVLPLGSTVLGHFAENKDDKLHLAITQLVKQVLAEREKLADAEAELTAKKAECAYLRDENARYHQRLEQQAPRTQEEAEKARKEYFSRTVVWRQYGDWEPHLKMEKTWERLSGCISSLVQIPKTTQVWDSLCPDIQKKLRSWTPKAEEFWGSDMGAQQLFMAWIWHILDDNIFSRRSADIKWAAPHWQAHGLLHDLLQEVDAEKDDEWTLKFHAWRRITISAIQELDRRKIIQGYGRRIDPQYVAQLVRHEIGPFVDKESEPLFEAVLQKTGERVAHIDMEFQGTLVKFAPVFHHPDTKQLSSFPYEPAGVDSIMKNSLGTSAQAHLKLDGLPVDLITRPLLRFSGDIQGEGFGYDESWTFAPMAVCVGWFMEISDDLLVDPDTDEEATG